MKLDSKLQFCHEDTKTRRDDMYFNLGAWWLNEKHQSFFIDQTGRFSGQRPRSHEILIQRPLSLFPLI